MLFWTTIVGLTIFLLGLVLTLYLNWYSNNTKHGDSLAAAFCMLYTVGLGIIGIIIMVICGIIKLIIL